MEGFLNINKQHGPTSFQVVEAVRKALRVKKVGHAGTLDPHATGVLVIGVGKATKLIPFVQELDKEYIATVKLGLETDTLDEDGEVLTTAPVPRLSRDQVVNALNEFVGEIDQVPPAFSAKKVQGERLYDLAREGIRVHTKPKKVMVHQLELLDMGEDTLVIRALVGKGTYIRALARDLAKRLGTVGMVASLIRTKVGHFDVESATPVDQPDLVKRLLPPDHGLAHMPPIHISQAGVRAFLHGNRISSAAITDRPARVRSFQLVRVYGPDDEFIGVGSWRPGGLQPKRVY